MNYKIEIKNKARKFIEKQNPEQQIRLLKAIYKIPNGDIKRLTGQNGLYRLRVEDYRVIYSMDNNKLEEHSGALGSAYFYNTYLQEWVKIMSK